MGPAAVRTDPKKTESDGQGGEKDQQVLGREAGGAVGDAIGTASLWGEPFQRSIFPESERRELCGITAFRESRSVGWTFNMAVRYNAS